MFLIKENTIIKSYFQYFGLFYFKYRLSLFLIWFKKENESFPIWKECQTVVLKMSITRLCKLVIFVHDGCWLSPLVWSCVPLLSRNSHHLISYSSLVSHGSKAKQKKQFVVNTKIGNDLQKKVVFVFNC